MITLMASEVVDVAVLNGRTSIILLQSVNAVVFAKVEFVTVNSLHVSVPSVVVASLA